MAKATNKIKVTTIFGENCDATIFSSGGVTHTVEVENIDSGEIAKQTFSGKESFVKAIAYAREICKK